jgi:hypothetical protein
MKANLNPTFKKQLNGKSIKIDFEENFVLTPYELNQISFWLNVKTTGHYKLPTIVPVSKRFVLDFVGWDNPQYNDVLLLKFKKSFFIW